MKRRKPRIWLLRGAIVAVLLVPLLFWLSGCWLVNVPPVAAFTMSDQTGQAPLTVNFSAVLSEDEDGEIVKWEWDFGDGTSGTGETVAHTYNEARTFVIVLRVTDDGGTTATTQKSLYVLPAEPPGPVASFTASPSSGTSPLTVNFNATASTYEDGTIASYEWDFGDGRAGYGPTVSHTYISAGAQTYTVTLTVRATDGKTGTTTTAVSVTAAGGGGTPGANAPSARFTIDESIGVAPFQVHFDPSDSEAAEGRTIILYTWSFGDGDATSDVNPSEQEHVYVIDDPSKTFSVTLIVLDNEGDSDSITKTVKIYNFRPVAGFDIANPPGGDKDDAGAVEYATLAAAHAADRWEEDNVVYGDIFNNNGAGGAFPVTITVVIRSRKIPDADWFDLDGTLDQDELRTSTTSATSSTSPGAPDDYDDHNFSYDPEGQTWNGGTEPAWFPASAGEGWGVRYLYISWGDGSAEDQIKYAEDDWTAYSGDVLAAHDYDVTVDGTVRTITVTAEDWLGQKSAAFSRQITLKVGYETNEDEI